MSTQHIIEQLSPEARDAMIVAANQCDMSLDDFVTYRLCDGFSGSIDPITTEASTSEASVSHDSLAVFTATDDLNTAMRFNVDDDLSLFKGLQ